MLVAIRWLLCMLLSSRVRVGNNSVWKKIVWTSCIVHVLFTWIYVCVILQVNIIVHIISHMSCWLLNLIFRPTLRSMPFAIHILRIHNSIRMASLVGIVNLSWLWLIHLTSSRPCRTWMKPCNTTRSCIDLFILTLISTTISYSNNILSITESHIIMWFHSCLCTLANVLSSVCGSVIIRLAQLAFGLVSVGGCHFLKALDLIDHISYKNENDEARLWILPESIFYDILKLNIWIIVWID